MHAIDGLVSNVLCPLCVHSPCLVFVSLPEAAATNLSGFASKEPVFVALVDTFVSGVSLFSFAAAPGPAPAPADLFYVEHPVVHPCHQHCSEPHLEEIDDAVFVCDYQFVCANDAMKSFLLHSRPPFRLLFALCMRCVPVVD